MKKILFLILMMVAPLIAFAQPSNYYMSASFGAGGSFDASTPVNGFVSRTIEATSTTSTFNIEWNDQYNEWFNTSINYNEIFALTFNPDVGLNHPSTLNVAPTVGKYYVFNINGFAYSDRSAVLMELSAVPVTINSVSGLQTSGSNFTFSIETSATKSAEEKIYVRYTTDSWTSSKHVLATGSGSSLTAVIPVNAVVQYYVLSTTVSLGADNTTFSGNYDLVTIKLNNNGGSNYFYYSNSITGTQGWRLLSSPVTGATFSDLLGDFWTQGIATGAKTTNGSASVLTYDGSDFVAVADLGSTVSDGAGFAAYIYSDDDFDDNAEGFPKTISITGTENTGPVSVTLNTNAQDSAWTLAGNPFASTVDWDSFTTSGLTGVVYVYNPAVPGYISWNGTTGSLTDGLIAPFQGFFVKINNATHSLSIPTAAKSSGGTLYKTAPKSVLALSAEMGSLKNNAYFSFTDNASEGLDNFDAYKLNPLDLKNYLSLATVAGGNALDINNLPLSLTQQVSIPIQINAFEATGNAWKSLGGQVNLSWSQIESLPSSWSIVLVDELNGDRINMREQTNYGFALEAVASKAVANEANMAPKTVAATSNSRFRIEVGPMTTSVKELETLPNSISLNQNYPNPFNPSTQISFSLPTSMDVNLTVFDMLGREVATLVNGAAKAGLNTVNFNASKITSGIYFYRLNAGNTVLTKKMSLIK